MSEYREDRISWETIWAMFFIILAVVVAYTVLRLSYELGFEEGKMREFRERTIPLIRASAEANNK